MIKDPVSVLAEIWASMDGKLDDFRAGREDRGLDSVTGTYPGYMMEAAYMIERAANHGVKIEMVE